MADDSDQKTDQNTAPKLITVTESAQVEVKRLIEAEGKPGTGLRLGIKGGGCSGLSYALDFTEHRDGDTVVDYDGFQDRRPCDPPLPPPELRRLTRGWPA